MQVVLVVFEQAPVNIGMVVRVAEDAMMRSQTYQGDGTVICTRI